MTDLEGRLKEIHRELENLRYRREVLYLDLHDVDTEIQELEQEAEAYL